MSRGAIIGVGVATVVALAVAFGLGGGDGDVAEESAFGDVTVAGQPLPRLTDPAQDPAVGLSAPVVSGVDPHGDAITVGGPGDNRIVMFLAHWCSHCQAEVPRVVDYLSDHDPVVTLQSVATSSDPTRPNFGPVEWLEGEGWPVPVLLDDEGSQAGAAYGLSAFPFWVVLDGDGVVRARFSGELGEDQFAALVDEVAAIDG